MIRKAYRCNSCGKVFSTPQIYYETHNLDSPPYEREAICPKCQSLDFITFEPFVEKSEAAERLLNSIAAFNRYSDIIKNVFGNLSANRDFEEGYETLTEFISEMFSFITVDKEREIFNLKNQNDIQKILLYLKG